MAPLTADGPQSRTLHNPIARSVIGLWVLCGLVLLASLSHAATYGPAGFVCGTSGTELDTGDTGWRATVAGAAPGAVFVFRAGTYPSNTDPILVVPNGVQVMAYGAGGVCETVIFEGAAPTDLAGVLLTMGDDTVLAGVTVRDPLTGNDYAGVYKCNGQSDVTIRNNNLYGGRGDTFFNQGSGGARCQDIVIRGNDINGSKSMPGNGGHNFLLNNTGNTATIPLRWTIDANQIQSTWYAGIEIGSDDTVAVEAGCDIKITNNFFPPASQKNTENVVDVKSRISDHCNGAVLIEGNTFAADMYTGTAGGQDGFGSPVIFGDHYGAQPTIQHIFRKNLMLGCDKPVPDAEDPAPNFSCLNVATGNRHASVLLEGNIFVLPAKTVDDNEERVYIGSNAFEVTLRHNTFYNGIFKMRTSAAGGNRIIQNNALWNTYVDDETTDTAHSTVSWNGLFSLNDTFNFDDGNNITDDPLFANAPDDLNPTAAVYLNSGSDNLTRGAHREVTFTSGTINGTSAVLTFDTQGTAPILCGTAPTLHDIEYDAVDQTESACVAGAGSSNVTLTMGTSVTTGQTVTWKAAYGAVTDSYAIGGPEGARHNKSKAQAVAQSITNEGGGGGGVTNWNVGLDHTKCTGTDPVMVCAVGWEDTPTSVPLDISNVAYGGQALTQVASVDHPDGTLGVFGVLSETWILNEAGIMAATNTTLTYDTSQAPTVDGTTDKTPVWACGCYTGINQVTPTVDSDVGTNSGSTTVSTPALTTATGVAVMTAISGGAGSWTADSPWDTQINATNPTGDPTKRLLVAESDITDVTPGATQNTPNKAMTAVALNGGAEGPAVAVRTQVAWRVADWTLGLTAWIKLANTAGDIVPGGKLLVMLQMQATDAAEAEATEKKLLCSDNGGDEYAPANTFGSNLIAFTPFAAALGLDNAAQIPCPSPLGDPGGGGSCQTGRAYDETGGFDSTLLSQNNYSPFAFSLQISAAASSSDTIQCSLTPLDTSTNPLTLTVHDGRALGSS